MSAAPSIWKGSPVTRVLLSKVVNVVWGPLRQDPCGTPGGHFDGIEHPVGVRKRCLTGASGASQ